MPGSLEEALQLVESMENPANFTGEVRGVGPEGFLEVSDRVKSIDYFLNMPWKMSKNRARTNNTFVNEFVWDPINLRFCTLANKGKFRLSAGSPHQTLAAIIGADVRVVCGGTIRRPGGEHSQASLSSVGTLMVTEMSGHFYMNWSYPIRRQFKKYMQLRTGLIVQNDGYVDAGPAAAANDVAAGLAGR